MITKPRWELERRLMFNNFPEFTPFVSNEVIGFCGTLRGKHSGRVYAVTIQSPIHSYPALEPAIFINPRPESHHWLPDGRLCAERQQRWQPGRDTFATAVLVAVRYIDKFDPRRYL